MLWKFKKTIRQGGAALSASSNSSVQDSSGAAIDRSVMDNAVIVENVDAAAVSSQGAYVIPKTYRVAGTIVTSRPVVLEGEIAGGGLVAPTVHVGSAGRLNAPTQAAIVTVSGLAESPISARDYVEVRKGGAIEADVEAGSISILPGGTVSGSRLAIGPLRSQ